MHQVGFPIALSTISLSGKRIEADIKQRDFFFSRLPDDCVWLQMIKQSRGRIQRHKFGNMLRSRKDDLLCIKGKVIVPCEFLISRFM